ncbi:alternative oxidase [Globomyces pollinis-pini]|nr:alternative oxidase [Globomyces pollinis-pini]
MERDHGWIHTLLEEAENERMHLMTFMKLRKPGVLFRSAVIVTQGLFMNGFFFMYLISPRLCHRFVGYLEEEAVHTYTDILNAMDDGRLAEFAAKPAPQIAIDYWKLPQNANMRQVVENVRADESNHRDVNHTFASIDPDETNPYIGKH